MNAVYYARKTKVGSAHEKVGPHSTWQIVNASEKKKKTYLQYTVHNSKFNFLQDYTQ